jgi:hypothetical protein
MRRLTICPMYPRNVAGVFLTPTAIGDPGIFRDTWQYCLLALPYGTVLVQGCNTHGQLPPSARSYTLTGTQREISIGA